MESTTKIVINRELKFRENDDTRDLLILCRDDSFHVFPRATADAANGIEWTDNIADLTNVVRSLITIVKVGLKFSNPAI